MTWSHRSNVSSARRIVTGIGGGTIARELLHPQFRAWSLSAGDLSGSRFLAAMQRFAALFDPALQIDITGVTDGGDRVAVEATSHGDVRGGARYHNAYHFLLIFRDGLLFELREYLDPRALDAVRPLFT